MKNAAKNLLSNLEILTVGLVDRGAVSLETTEDGEPTGENLFLLKSKEDTMPNENETIEAVTPDAEDQPLNEQSIMDKVKSYINEHFARPADTDDQDDTQPEANEPVATPVEDSEVAKSFKAQLDATVEAVEKRYEAKLAELTEKVTKAEERVSKADNDREKREWLEKAESLTLALPVNRQEMADNLHAIAKAAPDRIEWLVATLKAADHQLTEAGLFSEMGTTLSPENLSLVEKANKIAEEKGLTFEKALLSLPKNEQQAILDEMRRGA